MSTHLLECAACKRLFKAEELDGKPDPKDMRSGETIEQAADRGVNFTRLECRDCYGPGYSEI